MVAARRQPAQPELPPGEAAGQAGQGGEEDGIRRHPRPQVARGARCNTPVSPACNLFPLVVDVGQIVGCQVIGSRGSRVPPGPPVHIIAFFLSHTAQQSTELQTNIDQE